MPLPSKMFYIFFLNFIMKLDKLSADSFSANSFSYIFIYVKDCGQLRDVNDTLDASFKICRNKDAK